MQKNLASEKYFLDTNVFLNAFFHSSSPDNSLVTSIHLTKLTNEYVLKEVRRVAIHAGLKQAETESIISLIKRFTTVVPTPLAHEFKKMVLTDKSDKPIVCSALKHGCTLVTNDSRTYSEAKKYVATKTPKEALESR